MPRLAIIERIRVIKLFNELPYGFRNKYIVTSQNAANKYGIFISHRGVRDLITKAKLRFGSIARLAQLALYDFVHSLSRNY